MPAEAAACGLCPHCHKIHSLPYSATVLAAADELCRLLLSLAEGRETIIPPPFDKLHLLPLAQSNEGKMVAVCQFADLSWGFAFSGQIHRQYGLEGFADHLADHTALADIAHRARVQINPITDKIKALQTTGRPFEEILPLKLERRHLSSMLCAENQALYRVANRRGNLTTLPPIWTPPPQYAGHGIPTGVGDCALPKILHWGNIAGRTPIAAAEFWWGGLKNPHKEWENGRIIPACAEKCQGIMGYLLCDR